MDLIFYGFAVLLFAACILMIEGAWLWWSTTHGSRAQRIAGRLRLMAARSSGGRGEKISILKQRRYSRWPLLDRSLRRVPHIALLDRLLVQSGLKWSVAQFLAGCALLLGTGLALTLMQGFPFVGALALSSFAPALPYLWLLHARGARLRKIEAQLPDAADFFARALRAGHSFSNVLQTVSDELQEPISGEFKLVYEEINYGASLNEALRNMAGRVPLTDLGYLIVAVLIQRESGGNLAEILNGISRIMRERLKLLGHVRVMSAEGKMSAWVLGLLPVVTMLVMSVANPQYISMLWTDPTGIRLLWYAGGMIALGVLWMRNIIKIHV